MQKEAPPACVIFTAPAAGHWTTRRTNTAAAPHVYFFNQDNNMNTKDLNQIGVPQGEAMKRAHAFIVAFRESGGDMSQLENEIGAIVGKPAAFSAIRCAKRLRVRSTSLRSSSARRSRPGSSGAPASSRMP
jgi:hypothetical protein